VIQHYWLMVGSVTACGIKTVYGTTLDKRAVNCPRCLRWLAEQASPNEEVKP
jgi:hypothetical protein